MNEQERRREIFERMPYRQAVLKQILPAIASQMITLVYNLADTYFVGQLNSPIQTAAVTVGGTGMPLMTGLANLFGVGGASLMAQALGRREPEKAKDIAAFAFWAGTVLSVMFALLFYAFAEPILLLCGATAETVDVCMSYAKWTLIIGGPFSIINMMTANLIRAEGSAAAASLGLSLGGILNIILDPFFVLPQFLGLGAEGAGMATAFSNMLSTACLLFYVVRKRQTTVVSLRLENVRRGVRDAKRVLSIGFPSTVQLLLTVVAVSAQLNFVSKYGADAVAALGIVKKLDQLPLYFALGTATGLLPLLAYNYAVGNHKRQSECFRFGSMLSFGFAVACFAAYQVFAPTLCSLFMKDANTLRYAASFLRMMVVAMPFMALCYTMIIQMQAMGCAKESLVSSILRKGALDIPLLFILDGLWPLYGCMLVQPIVDAVSLVVVTILTKKCLARAAKQGPKEEL